jgi:hypothetical protein
VGRDWVKGTQDPSLPFLCNYFCHCTILSCESISFRKENFCDSRPEDGHISKRAPVALWLWENSFDLKACLDTLLDTGILSTSGTVVRVLRRRKETASTPWPQCPHVDSVPRKWWFLLIERQLLARCCAHLVCILLPLSLLGGIHYWPHPTCKETESRCRSLVNSTGPGCRISPAALEERRPEAAGPWAEQAVMQGCQGMSPAPGRGELLQELLTLAQRQSVLGGPDTFTSLWALAMGHGGFGRQF